MKQTSSRSRLPIWLPVLVLLAQSAGAATYFVATTGADTDAGSQGSPWRTIQKAASTMVAGDTVNIVAGTYDESITMQNAGTAADRITYQSYNGGTVVVPQTLTITQDYVVVKGLEISGGSVRVEGSHCQVLDSYIHHSGVFGMFIHGSYNLVRGNTIANNGSSWGGQVTTGWGTGHHIVFEYNEVSDPEGMGEDFMQYLGHDFIVRGNTFHHLGDNGRHNDCYQSGGGEYNIWFIGNSFTHLGNVQYFMVGTGGDADHVWRHNMFWGQIGWGFNGASSGMRVANNTFGTSLGGYGYSGGGLSRNNIYHDWGTNLPYNADSADYNLIQPIPTWGNTKQPHDLWGVDPAFVSFSGRDFHLQSTSPCIDAGTFLTTTTTAGSGTQLPVADARFFVDGFGIADGDTIQLEGQTLVATIESIDYATGVLSLDTSLTWTSGLGVSVPYSGSAPDMGAFEYASASDVPVDGAWYVDRNASGSGDGTSWTNAWTSFGSVVWGSNGVEPGDTLFIDGGSSSATHTETLNVGAAGNAAAPITISIGQDAGHSGTAEFTGVGINLNGKSHVAIDGGYGGQNRIRISGATIGIANGASGHVIKNVDLDDVGMGIALNGQSNDVHHNRLTNVNGGTSMYAGIRIQGGGQAFDLNSIHDNEIHILVSPTNGYGPDNIQTSSGLSIYNNTFTVSRATYALPTPEHPDTLQAGGSNYLKVYGNDFIDVGDSAIQLGVWFDHDLNHVWIYNNVFRLVNQIDAWPEYIRLYANQGGVLGSINNLKILNNLFVDNSDKYIPIRIEKFGGNPTGTGNEIRNNIFCNMGTSSYHPVVMVAESSGWTDSSFEFGNNVYHGPDGLPYVAYDGQTYSMNDWMSFKEPSAVTSAPSFVSYVVNGSGNDFHLADDDTAARDGGADLSSCFSTDRDGVARPQGVAWDIGPYEFTDSSSDTQAPTVPADLVATVASATQVDLSWTPSTDDVGVAGYVVYRDGTSIWTTTGTGYSDDGVVSGATYAYTVAAYDAASNTSAQSPGCSVTTTNSAPVVDFAAPADGATISGVVAAQATAHDPDVGTADGQGIQSVLFELLRAGVVVASHTEMMVTYDWSLDTTVFADGLYTMRATATGTTAAGGGAATVTIDVTLSGGSSADLDSDLDGLPDWWETRYGLDPGEADSDDDGIADPDADLDGDGSTNHEEFLQGTDPNVADHAGDAPRFSCTAGGVGGDLPFLLLALTAVLLGRRRPASNECCVRMETPARRLSPPNRRAIP